MNRGPESASPESVHAAHRGREGVLRLLKGNTEFNVKANFQVNFQVSFNFNKLGSRDSLASRNKDLR